jgi:hypothetical protein
LISRNDQKFDVSGECEVKNVQAMNKLSAASRRWCHRMAETIKKRLVQTPDWLFVEPWYTDGVDNYKTMPPAVPSRVKTSRPRGSGRGQA